GRCAACALAAGGSVRSSVWIRSSAGIAAGKRCLHQRIRVLGCDAQSVGSPAESVRFRYRRFAAAVTARGRTGTCRTGRRHCDGHPLGFDAAGCRGTGTANAGARLRSGDRHRAYACRSAAIEILRLLPLVILYGALFVPRTAARGAGAVRAGQGTISRARIVPRPEFMSSAPPRAGRHVGIPVDAIAAALTSLALVLL